jgi:hypothetical protein
MSMSMCYLHANPKSIQLEAKIARVESEHSQDVLCRILHILYHCFGNNSAILTSEEDSLLRRGSELTDTSFHPSDWH